MRFFSVLIFVVLFGSLAQGSSQNCIDLIVQALGERGVVVTRDDIDDLPDDDFYENVVVYASNVTNISDDVGDEAALEKYRNVGDRLDSLLNSLPLIRGLIFMQGFFPSYSIYFSKSLLETEIKTILDKINQDIPELGPFELDIML